MRAEALSEEPVVSAVPVSRVAKDGMENVPQVPAQLMPAPSVGLEFDQRVARGLVAAHGFGQFHPLQTAVIRNRALAALVCVGEGFGVGVDRFLEGIVDTANLVHVTSCNSVVGLARIPASEDLHHGVGHLRVQREHQDPGSGLVQAVKRKDMLSDLIANHLHGKAPFAAVHSAAMDQ